jgi:hypothetical protein
VNLSRISLGQSLFFIPLVCVLFINVGSRFISLVRIFIINIGSGFAIKFEF